MKAIKFIQQHGVDRAREVVDGAPETATHFELTIDGVFYFKYEKFDWLCFGDNQLINTYMEDHESYRLISLKDLKRLVDEYDRNEK